MKETNTIIGVMVGVLLLVAVVFFIGARRDSLSQKVTNPGTLVREYDYKLGNTSSNPPIQIVEFADFECPACLMAYQPLNQIVATHPDVQLVYRYFPLDQHLNAVPAAKAAAAAGIQGKFWEMHDALFAKQPEWANVSDPTSLFDTYAQSLGLDLTKLHQDEASAAVSQQIQTDSTDGTTLGVNSTPTIYINGRQYNGALTEASLNDALKTVTPTATSAPSATPTTAASSQ